MQTTRLGLLGKETFENMSTFFFFKSTHSYKVQTHQDGFFLFSPPAIVFFIFPKNEQGGEMPRQIPEDSGKADGRTIMVNQTHRQEGEPSTPTHTRYGHESCSVNFLLASSPRTMEGQSFRE